MKVQTTNKLKQRLEKQLEVNEKCLKIAIEFNDKKMIKHIGYIVETLKNKINDLDLFDKCHADANVTGIAKEVEKVVTVKPIDTKGFKNASNGETVKDIFDKFVGDYTINNKRVKELVLLKADSYYIECKDGEISRMGVYVKGKKRKVENAEFDLMIGLRTYQNGNKKLVIS